MSDMFVFIKFKPTFSIKPVALYHADDPLVSQCHPASVFFVLTNFVKDDKHTVLHVCFSDVFD